MNTHQAFRKVRLARRTAMLGGCAAFCSIITMGGPVLGQHSPTVSYMRPDEAHRAAQSGQIILVDIRRPEEWVQTGVADGAIGLDMTSEEFVESLVALRMANPEKPLALICRTGNRTGHVTTLLAQQGFPGLIDVQEGMVGGRYGPGWLKRGLPIYDGSPDEVRKRNERALP